MPIIYGSLSTLTIYIPFPNITTPSVNNNLLPSSYNKSTSILTILNVGTSSLNISGFLTYESTAPVTLFGNLSYNNIVYYYFSGYDVTMTTPHSINILNLYQSNTVVG